MFCFFCIFVTVFLWLFLVRFIFVIYLLATNELPFVVRMLCGSLFTFMRCLVFP